MASSSSDLQSGAVASAEVDEGQGDDLKYDKKKKFKPFQKMRNFFRGGSKKARFKPEEIVGQKSHSVGALHHKHGEGDDDDDGGFMRGQGSGLAGSRSISEDSVFKPELKEYPGILQGQAVSMENIDSNLHIQSLSKSGYQESDQSLRSMEGMSDEELLPGNMKSMKREHSSSVDSLEGDLDFEAVQVRTTSLSNEAAKHRISVKPKARRVSSKVSMRRRDRSPVPGQLENVEEESSSKSDKLTVPDSKQSAQHKTIISTTIPVGNTSEPVNIITSTERKEQANDFRSTISGSSTSSREVDNSFMRDLSRSVHGGWEPERSQARDIPGQSRQGSDRDRSRPRSLSPLSTSPPMTTAMLQEVKLKARPGSIKPAASENTPKDTPQNNELAKAFDRAKRISRKFDDNGVSELEAHKSEVKPVETVKQTVKPQPEAVKPTEILTKPADNTITVDKNVFSVQTSNNQASGVSFVLKKEPQRQPVKTSVTTVTSFGDNVETSSVLTIDDPGVKVNTEQPASVVKNNSADSTKDTKLTAKISPVHESANNNKLASPREEYRLKRQNRSKTLPVSKETMEKAEEKTQSSTATNRRSADYENVIINPKSVDGKRASWAPPSLSSTRTDTKPTWITKAKQIEQKQETEKTDKPKEVKIEPTKHIDAVKAKSPERATVEKPAESTAVTKTFTTQSSTVKQDKTLGANSKPNSEKTGYSITASRAQFAKTSSSATNTTKPAFSSTSDQSKPATVTSASKPPVSSVSKLSNTFTKPTEDASKSSSVTTGFRKTGITSPVTVQNEKPSIQSVSKPSVTASSKPAFQSDKQQVHSVKTTSTTTSNVTRFGGVTKATENSGTRPGLQKQSSTDSNKPSTVTPFSVKPVAANNKSNIMKTDIKETPKVQSAPVNKNALNQGNVSQQSNITPSVSSNRSGSIYGKSKSSFGGESNTGDTPRKFGSGVNTRKQAEMKIEIIAKDEPLPAKVEQKPATIQIREKPKSTPEKCSDVSGNRPSKVLDMVKSFQKLQVT